MKTGDKLPNGAVCIAHEGRTVLAGWAEHFPNQYVTWRVDEKGNCYLGHYFTDLAEAVADFDKRRLWRKQA